MAPQTETTTRPYIAPTIHLYATELSAFVAISFVNAPDITTNDGTPTDDDVDNQFTSSYRTHLWDD